MLFLLWIDKCVWRNRRIMLLHLQNTMLEGSTTTMRVWRNMPWRQTKFHVRSCQSYCRDLAKCYSWMYNCTSILEQLSCLVCGGRTEHTWYELSTLIWLLIVHEMLSTLRVERTWHIASLCGSAKYRNRNECGTNRNMTLRVWPKTPKRPKCVNY